jgi:two-component system chemotaxis response regulator CheY
MSRILLVEDSFSMRAFVRSALESGDALLEGVEVVEASSGFDALRLLPRGPV